MSRLKRAAADMLARYQIYRGKRPSGDPLPAGIRQDTRKHTRHFLRPSPEAVFAYLDGPSEEAWRKFADGYRQDLESRFRDERAAFDRLAEQAMSDDVYLGCNCPTKKNPDVRRCHTWLALEFMQERYPQVEVVFPPHVGKIGT